MKPKITVENIVESVTYKDSTRTEHRRKANLEKSKAREILREAEGAIELHGPGLDHCLRGPVRLHCGSRVGLW